jgi:hypothetical protein
MDPTAALIDLRATTRALERALELGEDDAISDLASDAVMLFYGLDEWLSQGGFLPAQWRSSFSLSLEDGRRTE